MDKYEFNIKVEQIKKMVSRGDYETAMKIADTIDWRRVRNVNILSMVATIYEKNNEYQEAKDILLLAFERAPIGKRLLFKLAELAIKEGSLREAEDYYREFCDLAPDDPRQYTLRYLILGAKGAPVEQLIHTLEQYCNIELDEKWLYELAELYAEAGMGDLCTMACDKIMLMFGLGKYVEKAMELKIQFAPLTKYQMDLVENRDKYEAKLRAVEDEYRMGVPAGNKDDDDRGAASHEKPHTAYGAAQRETAFTKEPDYDMEAGYEADEDLGRDRQYGREAGYGGETGTYGREAGYDGETGAYGRGAGYDGETGVYGRGAGYDGETGAYAREAGYDGESDAYGRVPGYDAETAAYGRNPGHDGEAAYGSEPEYGGEEEYIREPGHAGETAYGREPGYTRASTYGRESSYGEEAAYTREPGYDDASEYDGNTGRAGRTGFDEGPEYDNGEYGGGAGHQGYRPEDDGLEPPHTQVTIEPEDGEDEAQGGWMPDGMDRGMTDETLKSRIHEAQVQANLAMEMSKISDSGYRHELEMAQTRVLSDIRDIKKGTAPEARHFMIEAEIPQKGLEQAIESLKEIHKETGAKNQAAKITGERLNSKGVFKISDKLTGKDLIIEQAGDMAEPTLQELNQLMARDETGMNVVLIDTAERLAALHKAYPGLAKRFEYVGKSKMPKDDEYEAPKEDVRPVRQIQTNRQDISREKKETIKPETVPAGMKRQEISSETQPGRKPAPQPVPTERIPQSVPDERMQRPTPDRRITHPVSNERIPQSIALDNAPQTVPVESEPRAAAAERTVKAASVPKASQSAPAQKAQKPKAVPKASQPVVQAAAKKVPEPPLPAVKKVPEPPLPDEEEYEEDGTEMDIDEFAKYACEYASDIDCSISGKSMLALYERIEIMEEDGIPLVRANAEELIEEAADKAENPSFFKRITGIFSSKYDKDGLLVLKEEHFI